MSAFAAWSTSTHDRAAPDHAVEVPRHSLASVDGPRGFFGVTGGSAAGAVVANSVKAPVAVAKRAAFILDLAGIERS